MTFYIIMVCVLLQSCIKTDFSSEGASS